jgi:hypothetical protein
MQGSLPDHFDSVNPLVTSAAAGGRHAACQAAGAAQRRPTGAPACKQRGAKGGRPETDKGEGKSLHPPASDRAQWPPVLSASNVDGYWSPTVSVVLTPRNRPAHAQLASPPRPRDRSAPATLPPSRLAIQRRRRGLNSSGGGVAPRVARVTTEPPTKWSASTGQPPAEVKQSGARAQTPARPAHAPEIERHNYV